MPFFKQLAELAPGLDLKIQMKEKNGKVTMSILPTAGSKDNTIKPFVVTGTPDELDEGFFDAAAPALEKFKGLVTNLSDFSKSVDDAEKKEKAKVEKKKTSEPKPRPGAKKKYSKDAAKKKEVAPKEKATKKEGKKKPAPPRKEAPKGPVERSIFDQEPAGPELSEHSLPVSAEHLPKPDEGDELEAAETE